jgi:hypothetical protein
MVSLVVGVAPACNDRLLGVVAVKLPLVEATWPELAKAKRLIAKPVSNFIFRPRRHISSRVWVGFI